MRQKEIITPSAAVASLSYEKGGLLHTEDRRGLVRWTYRCKPWQWASLCRSKSPHKLFARWFADSKPVAWEWLPTPSLGWTPALQRKSVEAARWGFGS